MERIKWSNPMSVDHKASSVLDLNQLELPAGLPVDRIEVRDYTDTSGEASLRVLVVLAESVDLDHISGRDVGDLKWTIREQLRKHGFSQFAYIFMAKQSELDAASDEE